MLNLFHWIYRAYNILCVFVCLWWRSIDDDMEHHAHAFGNALRIFWAHEHDKNIIHQNVSLFIHYDYIFFVILLKITLIVFTSIHICMCIIIVFGEMWMCFDEMLLMLSDIHIFQLKFIELDLTGIPVHRSFSVYIYTKYGFALKCKAKKNTHKHNQYHKQ